METSAEEPFDLDLGNIAGPRSTTWPFVISEGRPYVGYQGELHRSLGVRNGLMDDSQDWPDSFDAEGTIDPDGHIVARYTGDLLPGDDEKVLAEWERMRNQEQQEGVPEDVYFDEYWALPPKEAKPQGNGDHWVYLNGHVGFGSSPHEIMDQMTRHFKVPQFDQSRLVNHALVNAHPQDVDYDVAWGQMQGKYPAFWQTNVDRNAVWDAVQNARIKLDQSNINQEMGENGWNFAPPVGSGEGSDMWSGPQHYDAQMGVSK